MYSETRLILKMMLTLYALLVNVTMHKQQSGCVVMFAEGGGTVYVQLSISHKSAAKEDYICFHLLQLL